MLQSNSIQKTRDYQRVSSSIMINIPKVGMYLFPHTKNRFNPPLPQNAVGAIFIPSNNCPHSLIYTRLETDHNYRCV